MNERQELFCHNCNGYVQFDDDMTIDGPRLLVCPRCRHRHYRVVRGGQITEERWGQDPSQGGLITITNATYATTSAYQATSSTATTYSNGGYVFLRSSWLGTTSGT